MKYFFIVHRKNLIIITLAWLLTTIPFSSQTPFNWDAAQYTLAVKHYAINMHQPHPPGYPLFVLTAKLFATVLPPHTSVLLVSVLFGLAAVITMYILVWQIWSNRTIAITVAMAFLVNPLFWLYRDTALTYSVDAFAVTLLMLCTYRFWYHPSAHTRVRYLYSSGIALGLVAGFRPSLMVLLAPVLVLQWWIHWRTTKQWRQIILAIGLTIVTYLVWFIPMVIVSGGLAAYRGDSQALYSMAASTTSIFYGAPWAATVAQIRLVGAVIVGAMNILCLPLLASLVWAIYTFVVQRQRKLPHVFWIGLAISIGPAVMYTLIHFGQIGYDVMFLPVLYLALVPALRWLLEHTTDWKYHATWLAVITAIIINAAGFLVLTPAYAHPEYVATNRFDLIMQKIAQKSTNTFKMNAQLIRQSDARILGLQDLVNSYDPNEVVVVAARNIMYPSAVNGLPVRNDEIFRELGATLPDYPVVQLVPDRGNYLLTQQYTTEQIDGWNVILPDTTKYVIFALNNLTDQQIPREMILEKRYTDNNQPYYFGLLERPFTFAGYTVQREIDSQYLNTSENK